MSDDLKVVRWVVIVAFSAAIIVNAAGFRTVAEILGVCGFIWDIDCEAGWIEERITAITASTEQRLTEMDNKSNALLLEQHKQTTALLLEQASLLAQLARADREET